MIINLTPHAINFVNSNGDIYKTINPDGTVARLQTDTVVFGQIEDIPLTRTEFGPIDGLPDPQPGVYYIVSSLVAQQCKDRNDVYIPNESVRDSNGRIIGCKSLGKI